ncbi:MAG: DUF2945 domain-containing protein [Aquisalinus sp.]|nr:DUF2945 domain-containing protein [Aquisalinus sp.]
MTGYQQGTSVEWDWGNGTATGKITTRYTSDIEKTIKGSSVKREASADCPAYLIEQEDGDQVLKSHSEVREVT